MPNNIYYFEFPSLKTKRCYSKRCLLQYFSSKTDSLLNTADGPSSSLHCQSFLSHFLLNATRDQVSPPPNSQPPAASSIRHAPPQLRLALRPPHPVLFCQFPCLRIFELAAHSAWNALLLALCIAGWSLPFAPWLTNYDKVPSLPLHPHIILAPTDRPLSTPRT